MAMDECRECAAAAVASCRDNNNIFHLACDGHPDGEDTCNDAFEYIPCLESTCGQQCKGTGIEPMFNGARTLRNQMQQQYSNLASQAPRPADTLWMIKATKQAATGNQWAQFLQDTKLPADIIQQLEARVAATKPGAVSFVMNSRGKWQPSSVLVVVVALIVLLLFAAAK